MPIILHAGMQTPSLGLPAWALAIWIFLVDACVLPHGLVARGVVGRIREAYGLVCPGLVYGWQSSVLFSSKTFACQVGAGGLYGPYRLRGSAAGSSLSAVVGVRRIIHLARASHSHRVRTCLHARPWLLC